MSCATTLNFRGTEWLQHIIFNIVDTDTILQKDVSIKLLLVWHHMIAAKVATHFPSKLSSTQKNFFSGVNFFRELKKILDSHWLSVLLNVNLFLLQVT